MKKITILIFSILFTTILLAQEKMIDGVVAVVGEDIILDSEVETQYLQFLQEKKHFGGKSLRCDILENLMIQKILLHQAKNVDSIKIDDDQVESNMDQRMSYFISQMGSKEKLEKYFNKSVEDIKDDFRGIIREQMLIQQERQSITKEISITPSEVREYYNSIPVDSIPVLPTEYKLMQIVKEPPINPIDLNKTREKLMEFRNRIVNGESFSAIARLYSEDPGSAKNGGELGFLGRGQLFPEFEAVAFSLKKGEVSEIVKTKAGFHIIQLVERRGELINVRHILLSPKPSELDIIAAQKQLDSIAKVIRNGEMGFEEAAKKNSDTPDAINGGLMVNTFTQENKFTDDDLKNQPNLSYTVKRLDVGTISKPLPMVTEDNKKAFRIIMIKSKVKPHIANLKNDYNVVKEWALEEKKNKKVKEWIDNKRKDMYVRLFAPYEDCDFNKKED